MANYQKLQVGTALNIVKSDDANIPFPNVVESGVTGSVSVNQLQDVTGEFVIRKVQVGDVVVNNSTNVSATVTRVLNDTNLLINANIFTVSGVSYTLYAQNGKEGCVLYIGTGGNLRVGTASGQDVTFTNVLGGTFLPVQILKVFSTNTTASGFVALW